MFSEKKSKKAKKKGVPEISAPSNFEHRVHTGYDPVQGGFVGLPTQWTGIVDPTANRPKPIVDPSMVTNFELERHKVSISMCCFCLSFLSFAFCNIKSDFCLKNVRIYCACMFFVCV